MIVFLLIVSFVCCLDVKDEYKKLEEAANEFKDTLTTQVAEYFDEDETIIKTVVDLLDRASSYFGVISDIVAGEKNGRRASNFCCVSSFKFFFENPGTNSKLWERKLWCYCPYETAEECTKLYKSHSNVCDSTKTIVIR